MVRTAMIIAAAAALLAGCAPTVRTVIRNEMDLTGEAQVAKEGLTMKVTLLDEKAIRADSRLTKRGTYSYVNPYTGTPTQKETDFMAVTPPTFQVKITNNTGHVARMKGIVIRLMDSAGTAYEAYTRDLMAADDEAAEQALRARIRGFETSATTKSALAAARRNLKFLDDNSEVLPNQTETFYVCPKLPLEELTYEGLNKWIATQNTLVLRIFEVPSETDQAGNITKRVHFEFPLAVKSFEDTFTDGEKTGTRTIEK